MSIAKSIISMQWDAVECIVVIVSKTECTLFGGMGLLSFMAWVLPFKSNGGKEVGACTGWLCRPFLTPDRLIGNATSVAAKSATGRRGPNLPGGHTASFSVGGIFVSTLMACFGRLYGRPSGLSVPGSRSANPHSLPFCVSRCKRWKYSFYQE